MELSKNYDPSSVEDKWYRHWISKKYFNSWPDSREPFTVVIPPPNVTGVLHMGHTLNETVQDILVRRARMTGYNACWVPGSDHASIATEARVVQMLKEKGIDKSQLSREEFLKYAYEWKNKYGNIIYHQIEKLGCSVDWNRVSFTMDEDYYKAVIKVFVELFNKGLIYRGARMIHWDPSAKTALSDEEVEYKDVNGKLYYIKYFIADSKTESSGGGEYITIATQRPETIMGDTAVCVNPNDERYRDLKGKFAIIPLINKKVPIIFDEYVDPAFGTGALKVTPAHDINDYNLGLKHNLEVVDTLNEDGTLSAAALIYIGEDRFMARKKIVAELEKKGFISREEAYVTRLGYSQRTGAVVEPRISTQWFMKMKELAQPALKVVLDGEILIHPAEKFLATYRYWLENVKDWCISRQLWWGQQIPAYYDNNGNCYVAESAEDAIRQALAARPGSSVVPNLKQDPDVLDTWFSSWLWPIQVFKGITDPGNAHLKYYYPTSVLVTGQDIIFFWVARMIMAGMEFEKKIPFRHVYFTGMVRDKLGRKMSKSLGNSPDLLELIEKFGADAVRFGILISSPAGNDLLFDEASLEQGRNFNNKLWNALKLVKLWENRLAEDQNQAGEKTASGFAVNWFDNRLKEAKLQVQALYDDFKLSEALKRIYSLIWDDFCSWYLEWIKPEQNSPMDPQLHRKTISFFEELLQMLHPFTPFITEEIHHLLKEQREDICVAQLGRESQPPDEGLLSMGSLLQNAITIVRDARNKNQIKPRTPIELYIQTNIAGTYKAIESIFKKQVNASSIAYVNDPVPEAIVIAAEKDKFFLLTDEPINPAAQKEELHKELDHLRRFLVAVEKKLQNERFLNNAREEVVELERRKKADAETKIRVIEESLAGL